MPLSVLSTKLYAPPCKAVNVPRPRLLERLDKGLESTLTLISAPAGYGKSSLASEWIHSLPDDAVGWLSLDPDDNDATRLLAHLIASLDSAASPEIVGEDAAEALQDPKRTNRDVLEALINALSGRTGRILLVLDDYHVIDSPEIDGLVTFLLEHSSGILHTVILTRSDPGMPLARMRANRELSEIRAADLMFTDAEADLFFNGTMGLRLSAAQVAALNRRTEGWIAGLNLAAISVRGCPDADECVESISGSHRFMMDYLVEEVLERQSPETREFLIRTSILARMNGPLCDAVNGRSDGDAVLRELRRQNLFVTPLDEEGYWYRYHHLFGDLLRRRLRKRGEEEERELSRRAGEWCESNGLLNEAADFALASGNLEWVARIVERIADDVLFRQGDINSIVRWLERIPAERLGGHPKLTMVYIWAIFYSLRHREVETLLERLESELPEDADQDVRAEIDTVRGSFLSARGMMREGLEKYREAYAKSNPANPATRGMAALGIGYAKMIGGDTASAKAYLEESAGFMVSGGFVSLSFKAGNFLGFVLTEEGLLGDAEREFARALEAASDKGFSDSPILSLAYAGLAELALERNAVEEALSFAERAVTQCRTRTGYQLWFTTPVFSAIRAAMGNWDEALRLLDEGEEAMGEAFHTAVAATTNACRARVYLLADAQPGAPRFDRGIDEWLDGVDAAMDMGAAAASTMYPGFGCEFILLTAARAMSARNRPDEALELLRSLEEFSRAGGRKRSLIENLAIQAMAYEQLDDGERAASCAAEALELAAPEGFARVFIDKGPAMARLLRRTAGSIGDTVYAKRLLASFPSIEDVAPVGSEGILDKDSILDPLSDRELDVLRLIARGLSNGEIGEKLFISPQTVKTHTKNMYAKLGVHSRTGAVSRARGLGFLMD